MTVDGITQELAAHAVHYREKKVILNPITRLFSFIDLCFLF